MEYIKDIKDIKYIFNILNMECIYAIDLNNGLSKEQIIPWKSKNDLKFFADKTIGNVVIMGKNTYYSLPEKVRPLKNRLNVVLTSNPNETGLNGVIFTNNCKIYDLILSCREKYLEMYPFLNRDFKIIIIGGKKIYNDFIPICDKVWVTQIKKNYNCDLFLDYDYSKLFKDPLIINEDDELRISLYEKQYL